jgi:hypothetical protein
MLERSVWLALEIMVRALYGRSGTSNRVASPAMKPERVLIVDNRLFAAGRSGLRVGTSGLADTDFLTSLVELLSNMLKIETIEGRLGLI